MFVYVIVRREDPPYLFIIQTYKDCLTCSRRRSPDYEPRGRRRSPSYERGRFALLAIVCRCAKLFLLVAFALGYAPLLLGHLLCMRAVQGVAVPAAETWRRNRCYSPGRLSKEAQSSCLPAGFPVQIFCLLQMTNSDSDCDSSLLCPPLLIAIHFSRYVQQNNQSLYLLVCLVV